MPTKKATHQQTKQHNQDLVLKTFFENELISRAEIARVTKLTPATVSDMVATLIEEGLVKEAGYGASIGGRSPILLNLAADSRYLIGLNLAQDKFIAAVVNLRGEIKDTFEAPVSSNNSEQALQMVYQILDQVIEKGWAPIVGIGVGTPGLVNTSEGVVVSAVNLNWHDLPLARLLESRYHLPVSVLNDSQATAIGEFVYNGNYKSDGNLIVVNVGYGIGAGILINGRIFQGDGGAAGEIGHVVAQENGIACRCGRRGCLETVASTRAVIQRAQALAPEYAGSTLAADPQNITLESLKAACLANDPLARRVITEAGHYLGSSIAGLIGILNIKTIVLTGEMARFGEPWLQSVRECMLEGALARMAEDTQLEIGKLEFRGCILGASASMLLNGYSLLFTQTAPN
ncbi:MAG TPA: ROK family transcriptional regulator [Anaerolineales bacterium]|nr:ROK family transcriptional regulator [Anaerolineales bacterium]